MQTGTVTGHCVLPTDGTVPLAGTVMFRLQPQYLVDDDVIAAGNPTATLDGSGYVGSPSGFELAAGNADGASPQGFTYQVVFDVHAPDGTPVIIAPFPITVTAGETTDLSEQIPLAYSEGTPVIQGPAGPQGPPGPASTGAAIVFDQPTPEGSWTIVHNLGRVPNVQVWVDGQTVGVAVASTPTTATIVFPTPTAGQAVLA